MVIAGDSPFSMEIQIFQAMLTENNIHENVIFENKFLVDFP